MIGFSPFLRASRGASWGMLEGLGGLLGALGELLGDLIVFKSYTIRFSPFLTTSRGAFLGSLDWVQILHDKIFTTFEDI